MASKPENAGDQTSSDATRALRFMAVKAAVFIAVPLVVAVAVAIWVLQ